MTDVAQVQVARRGRRAALVDRLNVARRRLTQQNVLLVMAGLATVVLVGAPLFVLVRTSVAPSNVLPFDGPDVTLDNFGTVLGSTVAPRLVFNTLVYAGGTVLGGLVVAGLLTWLTERTDLPFRRALRLAVFMGLPMPPLAIAFGWILLLNPTNGTLTQVLDSTPFPSSLFNVYSLRMMVFVSVLAVVPTMYLMLSGVVRNMDPQLENAAAASGASRMWTLLRVTLPLLVPGLLSTSIFIFMIMVQAFEIPLAIGTTARKPTMSTWIFQLAQPQQSGQKIQYGVAAVFGIGLVFVGALLMFVYFRATRLGQRFRVVTGKGFRPNRIALGRWRYPAIAFAIAYVVLQLLPLLSLLWASLLRFYEPPSLDALSQVSLSNYASLFGSELIRDATINTVILIISTATITMLLSGIISWFVVRRSSRLSRSLDMIAFAPLAIPGIVFALAILLLYIRTPLYDTIWILVLAHVTIFLAFGTRTMNGALIQIHPELEHAATASGARWLTMLRKVLLPLVWPHFLNGWLWIMVQSMRDLTVPLMVASANTLVLSAAMWQLWTSSANVPGASALIILTTLGLLLLAAPLQRYTPLGLTERS